MQLATFRPALLKYSIHGSARTETTQDVTVSESTTCDEKEVSDINSAESTTYATPANLPNIETATKLIQGWMRQHRSKNRIGRRQPLAVCKVDSSP